MLPIKIIKIGATPPALAVFKGPTSKGKGKEEGGEGKERGKVGERKGGNGG